MGKSWDKVLPPIEVWKECLRVLKPDGYFLLLHTMYPAYRRKEIKLVGLIAIITGFKSVTRLLSIFKKIESHNQQGVL